MALFPRPLRTHPVTGRRRSGCLGCLPQLLLLFLGAGLVFLATIAVFAPWGFYLGGGFHILPYWQGWGVLHSKTGNYLVYAYFYPQPSGSRVLPGPSVGGTGSLCTPRGEIFRMRLGGGMRRGIGTHTDGEKIDLYMYYWPAFSGNLTADHRPSVELRGQWKNPNIVMDDHGSIFRAFNPDGTVDRGHSNKPYPGDITPVTLVAGSYSDFEAACKAPR